MNRKIFTVQNLTDKIKKEKINTSLPICVTGHYGEIYLLDSGDFTVDNGYFEECKPHISNKIFRISVPDIGPEPD